MAAPQVLVIYDTQAAMALFVQVGHTALLTKLLLPL
jgi:hypothetical protein